ncbi:sigma-70 family RNA polymerase sigma factor [Algiphilus sp. NNCM1]|uniref:sigma-70 family RNA polymerase sigma factor n=1 Tax=Algiphilus sp. TaxID=1872431 RepID=UPI001CA79711|nr:sigma-70 family RNA polymerase sigma factor [Algiphilus sp.]MBY8967068.1 sigma-70 family RNA polymerase sigma factor [Algiphilus acroporae]MCI5062634.1 sigma-70 family RNA polymerase sigma factor [Algiphilus sp.]MCI5104373.1 sigma-70 family RNA polymerase sigma factor [Algiphilus sp.]
MTDASDDVLLAATARGDSRAFAVLVERHAARVHGFAQSVLADRAEAEDVTQEVFVKLWQHADAWQAERAKLSTWLFRVTRNAALNYRQRVRPREQAWTEHTPDPATEALETGIERDEDAQRLQAAIATLPEQQRSAMHLVYGQGLRQKEAAQAMSLSLKAFEAVLFRARRRLREDLTLASGEAREDIEP